jgi:o-succinylbenzoate synthase
MAAYFHRYVLRSRGSLNAVSRRREFPGALIRIDDGVGCLHPWPEFGDAPIEEQLELLRDGGTTRVIQSALRMAKVDGAARRQGVSLFAGIEIPPSHFSWDQNQSVESQMRGVVEEGWLAIKTKGSKQTDETLGSLERLSQFAGEVPLKWRVDFNSCLTAADFEGFMKALPEGVAARLDFIEDPFPYDAGAWSRAQRELGARLACDKGLALTGSPRDAEAGYEVAVLKPGRREWRTLIAQLPQSARVVMTSAMDHAIGQSFAAYEAALAWKELGPQMDLCGLCTEHLFEKDEFFERIRSRGGDLEVDRSGTGLGFDEVLGELPWKEL